MFQNEVVVGYFLKILSIKNLFNLNEIEEHFHNHFLGSGI
jgi:hypothetical protein